MTREDPPRRRRELFEEAAWRPAVERLRRHRAGGPDDGGEASYLAAQQWLAEHMARLARTAYGSFIRSLGEAEFDDVIADAIWGRTGIEEEGHVVQTSRRGLLENLEHSRDAAGDNVGASAASGGEPSDGFRIVVVRNSAAYVAWFLSKRLIDAVRHRNRRERADERVTSEGGRAPVPRPARYDPVETPRLVGLSLGDAVRFAGVVRALAAGLPSGHPTRQVAADLQQKDLELWHALAGYLERDVKLREERLPWTYRGKGEAGVPASDNQARAWQARYYSFAKELEFLAPGEIPPADGGLRRDLYDHHVHRFRLAYRKAGVQAGRIVSTSSAVSGGGSGPRLIPAEWEPEDHETLREERGK